MECLAEDAVLRFLQGQLNPQEAASVHDHLAGCGECRAVVGDVALSVVTSQTAVVDSVAPSSTEGAESAELLRVGRYEILSTLGVGGMGIVYAAFDPQLHRKVALKLLRADRQLPNAGALQARLLREAQAMARLSHPNVVPVYDAGVFGGQVFVVMELVVGTTLKVWARERPRTWHEVLDVYLQAGAGLSAAHAAGIVHRDFKPDNVLFGADGRVRVSDFGLARSAPAPDLALDVSSSVAIDMTGTLTFAGTPAYMAAEQFEGGLVDERTDEFAFAVSLFEAIFRTRPFRGGSVAELARAVKSGVVTMPAEPALPPPIELALRRGLAPDPAQRYPTLGAMLAALEKGRAPVASNAPRRSLRWPIAVAGIAALSVATITITIAARPRHEKPATTEVAVVAPPSANATASAAPSSTVPSAISVASAVPSTRPRPTARATSHSRPPNADALIGDPWKK
jgi:serine/threonine protein kinase